MKKTQQRIFAFIMIPISIYFILDYFLLFQSEESEKDLIVLILWIVIGVTWSIALIRTFTKKTVKIEDEEDENE
ncbi:MAG: hypothetical protein K9J16_17875 [Melioribacteraceae bacterium]|nr:hypothetical protein [Melioribacteraceae bacterium]MCF8356636.1 hypothetical protein [Melioribacteraceae bacterium]MCF8396014.1 hypothetical protein [Melioribacteraceae bacterium]MCF8421045.1 hypothetical protein [Melioribacteraceae bacterium]